MFEHLDNLTQQDLEVGGTVFQIGVAPIRIDIITAATGLQFEEPSKNQLRWILMASKFTFHREMI